MHSINKKQTLLVPLVILFGTFFYSCGEEEAPVHIGPTNITLNNMSIYEKLPSLTSVALLGTNVTEGTIRYTLVPGEGSTHNSEFKVESTTLKTFKKFAFEDGSTKQIRIKVNDGIAQYEQTFNIDILELAGEEPKLTSSSFINNAEMPREFGADNGNVSPDLQIENIPAQSKSIAISMIDLDDNGSYHWAVWNIPTDKSSVSKNQSWSTGVTEGNNSFGEGYTGPFPPSTHTYQISVHFLNETLGLQPDEYGKLESTMIGKLLAKASLSGKYKP